MCVSKPKAPKVTPIPDRRPSVLPDQGDPSMRMTNRNRKRLMPSAMIFTNQSTLGSPNVGTPGTGGY